VFAPEGLSAARWEAGSRIVCFKIDRRTVDDALSDALGRQVMSRVDFTPIMPITAAPTRSWINMLLLFKEQLFRPDSLINQPLVGLPFVDSLVRGFLLAAHHSHRYFLTTGERLAAPRTFRKAVEIIEEEAHLPLTVSSIAARCGVSVRSLQQDFRRHMGASPMAYLREVRLRRAHQSLLESDRRRPASRRSPTTGALPTSADSLPPIPPATTSRRQRRCGAKHFDGAGPTAGGSRLVLDHLHNDGLVCGFDVSLLRARCGPAPEVI